LSDFFAEEKKMSAGTIFVVILALAFVAFIVYLAHLSRRSEREDGTQRPEESPVESGSSEKRPPLKRAG
jgi:hypothetical protein